MKKFLSYVLAIVATFALAAPAFAELQVTPNLDVEGVTATALNASAKVEWDPVDYTDGTLKGYVVWYDTKPASENGDSYAHRAPATGDLGNVTSYTVTGLENDTEYYFAVTAIDTNAVESKNWSIPADVTATPSADAGGPEDDVDPPQVTNAEALNKEEVKVEFSEAVVLPTEHPEDAFVIQNTDNFEDLVVNGAKMDEEDTTNKTVILGTDDQTKDANYKLTVGIDVEDTAGNPIRSDSSATAPFTGSDAEKTVLDTAGPEVVTIEVVDNTHFMINFNEAVVLGIDPSLNFVVTEKVATDKKLQVTEVVLGKNTDEVDDASALITTSAQSDVDYVVTVSGVKDSAGNDVVAEKSTGEFNGVALAGDKGGGDVTPPKDIATFLAAKILEAEKYNVKLTWKIPTENVGDVVEQLLYKSLDKGLEYTKEASLEPSVEEYQLTGLDAGTYWFKLTQKDAAGNESAGKIVKVVLSATGPEMLGLLLASVVLGKVITKKKK
ncbi:MAG: fibronectin type III domain-containing protein [Candidatus Gracilibacteria bacterium]|jgi:hypothetical protein